MVRTPKVLCRCSRQSIVQRRRSCASSTSWSRFNCCFSRAKETVIRKILYSVSLVRYPPPVRKMLADCEPPPASNKYVVTGAHSCSARFQHFNFGSATGPQATGQGSRRRMTLARRRVTTHHVTSENRLLSNEVASAFGLPACTSPAQAGTPAQFLGNGEQAWLPRVTYIAVGFGARNKIALPENTGRLPRRRPNANTWRIGSAAMIGKNVRRILLVAVTCAAAAGCATPPERIKAFQTLDRARRRTGSDWRLYQISRQGPRPVTQWECS